MPFFGSRRSSAPLCVLSPVTTFVGLPLRGVSSAGVAKRSFVGGKLARRLGVVAMAVAALAGAMLAATRAQAQTETVLANFTGTTGAAPGAKPKYGNLIQASDGNFYGMTSIGGANGDGAAFKMTQAGVVTLLHSFAGGTGDGLNPYGSLVQGTDGNFYGLTYQGGTNNDGVAFKMTTAGTVTVLHSFAGYAATDGANPYGSLVQGTDGNFYGMTTKGGTDNEGTAFKMTPAGAVTLLYSFTFGAGNGNTPIGSLVEGTDGNFYGMTINGGVNDPAGAVFQMTPAGTVTLLYSFSYSVGDGESPYGSLVQGADGNFYGLTAGGGNGLGSAFKMTPAGAVTLLHSFAATDGAYPYGSLVQGTDGNFYGLTYQGGTNNDGVAFQMTPAGTVTVLHSFAGGTADGLNPYGSLVQGLDGNFYGFTNGGGSSSDGVLFKQTTATTLAAPVILSSTATTVAPGGAFTLTYSVANAYTGATNGTNAGSSSLGYCFASNTASNATWTGVITGSATAASSPSLTAPSTAGTYTYSLTCGGMESNLVTLTVVVPVPTVTGVSPTSGTVSGGTSVTITGTNFTGATAVKFGTANATSFTVNTATQITAISPAGLAGAVDVTVTTANGTSATSSSDQFTYVRASVTFGVMSFSPAATEPQGTSQAITISEAITYGGARPTGAVTFVLNGVTYTATCTTAGSPETCSVTVPAGTIAALTPASYTVTAALAQDSAYNAGSGTSGTFTVQTVPVITWYPNSFSGYQGSALSAGVLDATTATTTGTFAYTATNSSSVTVTVTAASTLAVGTYTLTATFTPSNTGTYTTATATNLFTVRKQSVFVANTGGSLSSIYDGGTSQSSFVSGGGTGAAVDAAGYVWSINTNGSSVSLFTDAGALSTSYSGAGISGAKALAIDGNNITWIANGNGTISALTNAGAAVGSTPIDPMNGTAAPASISVDTAGSLWLAVPNTTTPSSSTVIEVIGAAGPISTPTVKQVINSSTGTKP